MTKPNRFLVKKQQIDTEKVSDEINIVESQIKFLKATAEQRLLTPEETKQLDLLIKNSLLLKGNQTTISASYTKTSNFSDAELVDIANEQKLIDDGKDKKTE
jgi:hypothetical protein